MKSLLFSALPVLLLGFVSFACAADTDKGMICPVSGKKATKVSVEYHGGEVYFCCKNCLKAFQADVGDVRVHGVLHAECRPLLLLTQHLLLQLTWPGRVPV